MYFDQSEEGDFVSYLDGEVEDYFVYEKEGQLVGAGGINYFYANKLARISWDMVHPDCQGMGIGQQLTKFRIEHIKKNGSIDTIQVRTTQVVWKFYEKMGFGLEQTKKDFWADGFDLYDMKMSIS